jgi:membrane-bound inhibitor of C-type lysozyme
MSFPLHRRAQRPPLILAALSLAAGLGLSVLAGLAPLRAAPGPEAEQAIRASYQCRGRFDAVELTALFFNRDPAEVILLVGETATRLPRQRSASGSRYGAGDQEFWIKGEEASWRLGPHPAATMQCSTQPAQSQR